MATRKRIHCRRSFIKTAGAIGLGTALMPASAWASEAPGRESREAGPARVPTRPFGKTGVEVSMLGLGGVLKPSDQLVFRQAIQLGVTYWDTADSYGWGKNETAIGKYFTRYPDHRSKVFLVTKAASSDPAKLTRKLDASLEKMNTSYVDMYLIHYVSDVKDQLTQAVKTWAQQAKADGKIRLFGFSVHKNMETVMHDAAGLGWIDGIMMSYNYRLMVKEEMKSAVAACVKAGIGLTAMKSQAAFSANFYSHIGDETDDALKMTERFMQKGFTSEQARLKAVWENPDIASICSAMSNMTILKANVEAALDRQPLSRGDRDRLQQYARRTAPGYCTGCAAICEPAVSCDIPISDILRYCMYHHGYGDRTTAVALFRRLGPQVADAIRRTDFSDAERRCPQSIAIGKVLRAALRELA